MAEEDLKFERLVVDKEVAKEMFKHNQYKSNQVQKHRVQYSTLTVQ